MINLIPREEQKRMAVDFYYRLVTLSLVLLGSCALIASISMLPSYFLSVEKNDSASKTLKIQKNEPPSVSEEQSLSTIKNINNEIDLIENSQKSKFSPSVKVINAVLLKKRSDIKITRISYENDNNGNKKINITGTAPSREVLLLFRQALENSSSFKNVNLPISNFVKGSNIQFYLSLIPV